MQTAPDAPGIVGLQVPDQVALTRDGPPVSLLHALHLLKEFNPKVCETPRVMLPVIPVASTPACLPRRLSLA